MTCGEFADLVFSMREAQKEYFKTRSRVALANSKFLEGKVDKALEERNERLMKEKKNESNNL